MRFQLLAATALSAVLVGCTPTEPEGPSYPADETYAASLQVDIPSMVKVSDNLYYKDLVVGTGTTATPGKQVVVEYTGYLTNGTEFDSGIGTDAITVWLLDNGDLITGWVYGIPGMKVGGTRKLVIGSNFAYGAQGRGTIPPNATLVFDVTLKEVK
jgi:FKBP-type peptidyl-prolyl cis-trans isomerase